MWILVQYEVGDCGEERKEQMFMESSALCSDGDIIDHYFSDFFGPQTVKVGGKNIYATPDGMTQVEIITYAKIDDADVDVLNKYFYFKRNIEPVQLVLPGFEEVKNG
jgi:hypothetical protein